MATKIEICSNALLLLGADPIASFEDGTAEADLAANLYPTTYRDLLTYSAWRFNLGQKRLNRLLDAPLNTWQYAYQLPADLLLLRHTRPVSNYQLFDRVLYTNASTVEIDYSFEPGDESALPAYFVALLELRLAQRFAVPLTEDEQKADYYRTAFEAELPRAVFRDAQSRPIEPIQDSPFISCRR